MSFNLELNGNVSITGNSLDVSIAENFNVVRCNNYNVNSNTVNYNTNTYQLTNNNTFKIVSNTGNISVRNDLTMKSFRFFVEGITANLNMDLVDIYGDTFVRGNLYANNIVALDTTISIGSDVNTRFVDLGNGPQVKTINIGTQGLNSGATINIGSVQARAFF